MFLPRFSLFNIHSHMVVPDSYDNCEPGFNSSGNHTRSNLRLLLSATSARKGVSSIPTGRSIVDESEHCTAIVKRCRFDSCRKTYS